MSSVDTAPAAISDLQQAVVKGFNRKQMIAFGVPTVILLYLVYVFFAFDIPGIASRARLDNAAILVSDFWSHKTHVTRDNRSNEVSIAIEGETKGTYPEGMMPEWVTMADGVTRIDLDKGHEVIFDDDGARYIYPGYGVIDISPQAGKLRLVLPDGGTPDWINASDTRVAVTTEQGRFSYTRNRTEVFKYQAGWELFFFTLDSPFYGKSFVELVQLATIGERVYPDRTNFTAMVHDFWTNAMWRHGDVAWALFETVLMAFLGTMGAAMIALPLAFFAATNFFAVAPDPVHAAPHLRFPARRRRAYLDHHPVARLRAGADDRGAGHFAHRHRHLRQDLLRGARKHRQQAGRRRAVDRCFAHPAGPLWRHSAGHACVSEPGSVLFRIKHPLSHSHRRDRWRRHRAVADTGHFHPEGLGRSELLHHPDHPDGDGDGHAVGLAEIPADRTNRTPMRYAIYFAPEPASPLAEMAARWIGRDAATGKAVQQPDFDCMGADELAGITGPARRYGFHGNAEGPVQAGRGGVSDRDLIQAMEKFCAGRPRFVMEAIRGRFHRQFRRAPARGRCE